MSHVHLVMTRMFAWCVLGAAVASLLGATVPAAAQQRARIDSLVARGDSALALGNAAEARSLYEAALDIDDHARNALLGCGRALLALDLWGDAKDCFTSILKRDSSDITAHYEAGIAYRETGKTKAWILRNFDWGTSRDEFFWVMRHDSSFDDVLYQYARLLECRKEYPRAIAAGHAQIVKRPDLPGAGIGLYRLYRSFVANDRASAIEWLRGQGTPIATLFLADALRRENRLDEAEEMLDSLLASGTVPQTQSIFLSLARIDAKRDSLHAAEVHFWEAVDAIGTRLGADLVEEDLKYLVSDEEMARFSRTDLPKHAAAFFHGFWDARNPAASGASNVRIGEHYRRLVYAEENFEYTGFRTGFNNPDQYRELRFPKSYRLNQEFNDKGLIYIRHGGPDNLERAAQPTEPGESWLYEATGETPRRIFHFQRMNATGNNWRLIPYPQDVALLSVLTTWDVKFGDLLRNDPSVRARMRDEIIEQSRETVGEALATDEHTWKKEVTAFQFPFSIDAFRSAGPKSLIDISYAIPLASLSAGMSTPGRPIPAEIGLAIRSLSGQSTVTRLDTITVPPEEEGTRDVYMSLYRYLVPPDAYSIAMHVRPLEGNSFGKWKAEKTIPRLTSELALSDIQFLLPSSLKTTLEIDGVKVVPSPFSEYANTAPLYTYFHVYDLIKDADGKTSYAVRYLLTPAPEGKPLPDIDPENPGEKTILLAEKKRDGNEERGAEFGTLDLGNVKAGRYLLTIAVKDRNRVQTVMGRRTLVVFEP